MSSNSARWESNTQAAYVPVLHNGTIVGFCRPDYARKIVQPLNEVEHLRKALQLACYELTARMGRSSESVTDLVESFLMKVSRPLRGVALIAVLLKERQIELDLNDEEFVKFCDSYRLSHEELMAIYNEEEVDRHQLIPLSRILGRSVDEVINAWQGDE